MPNTGRLFKMSKTARFYNFFKINIGKFDRYFMEEFSGVQKRF